MKKEITEEKKTRLAYTWAIIALVCSLLICLLVVYKSSVILPMFLGVATVIYGPVTAFLYLREVKNGVFKVEDEDE